MRTVGLSLLLAPEFRLLYAVMLSVLVLAAAWQLARRFNAAGEPFAAASDALLLFYLVQYLSICIPGVLGALHPATIALVALLLSSVMMAAGMRRRARDRRRDGQSGVEAAAAVPVPDERSRSKVVDYRTPPSTAPRTHTIGPAATRAIVAAACLFLVGYVGGLVVQERHVPVMSNDALTYHLPAAVQWLQTGRLGLYQAWYYNPANSYSPLAGSAFAAWLIAPLHNDVLARFVQVGPLVLLLVAMVNVARGLGVAVAPAILLALGAVLSRSFVSQTILAKDDLFVAAFFVVLVDAMRRERLETRFGAWRAGIALGLLLATKFTVLLSLPILLLMLGRGWNWRRMAVVAVVALLIAGPWYLRNAILTGNPLYPTEIRIFGTTILPGILHLRRSELISTVGGAWAIFTNSYYGVPVVMAAVMIAGWIAAWIFAGRRAWTDRFIRTCLIGPVIGIALFVALAPYGEMRFAYPALLLLFACLAIVLSRLPEIAQAIIAAAVALLASWTAFVAARGLEFIVIGAILATAGAVIALLPHAWRVRVSAIAAILVLAIGGVTTYVFWSSYLDECEVSGPVAWSWEGIGYPAYGPVWGYVRDELPRGSTIAYANTYFTYPLMGWSYDHRVVYAPTRREIERFADLPRINEPTTGEAITGRIVEELRKNPDRDAWLRRLRESGAAYLLVMKFDPAAPDKTANPPELGFATSDAAHFARVYDDEHASVFKVNW